MGSIKNKAYASPPLPSLYHSHHISMGTSARKGQFYIENRVADKFEIIRGIQKFEF